ETSGPYRVAGDGKLLDTKTGRVMGDVQGRANSVAPGDITFTKEATTGPSEGPTGSPTVSPDAPAKPETSKGKAAGEDQSSEARADPQELHNKLGLPDGMMLPTVFANGNFQIEVPKSQKKDLAELISSKGYELIREGDRGGETVSLG